MVEVRLEEGERIVKRGVVNGEVRHDKPSTGWELSPPPLKGRTAELLLTNKRLILSEEGVPDLRLLGSFCPACTIPDETGTPRDLAERGEYQREPTPQVHTTVMVELATIKDSRAVKPFLRRERLRIDVDRGKTAAERLTVSVDDPNDWVVAIRRFRNGEV